LAVATGSAARGWSQDSASRASVSVVDSTRFQLLLAAAGWVASKIRASRETRGNRFFGKKATLRILLSSPSPAPRFIERHKHSPRVFSGLHHRRRLCRTFQISHGPAGPLAVATGSALVSYGDGVTQTGRFGGDDLKPWRSASVHLALRISVLPQTSVFWIAEKLRPAVRTRGDKSQMRSDKSFDARCSIIGDNLSGAVRAPVPFDHLFVWSEQRHVFLCRTFKISHGRLGPLAVATGWAQSLGFFLWQTQ
jgi:hypothetical protein